MGPLRRRSAENIVAYLFPLCPFSVLLHQSFLSPLTLRLKFVVRPVVFRQLERSNFENIGGANRVREEEFRFQGLEVAFQGWDHMSVLYKA